MKKCILFIFLLFVTLQLYSQSEYTVSGTIKDTTGQIIPGANILIATYNDTLRTISQENGTFKFNGIKFQNFTLRVTALGFTNWEQQSSINSTHDFQVFLKTSPAMLKEFVVRGKQNPVSIKKDTVEYDLNAIDKDEGDMVQDLLSKLPGLEVNSDGTVSLMGQKITKVMINGQEFLVSDIKTLTQLIPADLINKIQLIDDYGEQSRATGRRNGAPQKVLNLKTNAAVKDILSGRLSALAGTEDRYRLYAGVAKFNEQQQFNMGLTKSNTDVYPGIGDNIEGEGAYKKKFSKKLSVNSGFTLHQKKSVTTTDSKTDIMTSEGQLFNTQDTRTDNNEKNGVIRTQIELQPDSNNRFVLNLNGNFLSSSGTNNTNIYQTGFQKKDQQINNRYSDQKNDYTSTLNYSHYFNKQGRVITLQVNTLLQYNSNNQNNNNLLRYFEEDTANYRDSVLHQIIKKKFDIHEEKGQIAYIEPIHENASLQFKYQLLRNQLSNTNTTFWVDDSGKESLVDSLSNDYKYTVSQQQAEINYQKKLKYLDYTIGLNIRPYKLSGNTQLTGTSIFPVFQLSINPTKSSNINIQYTGENTFPNYQQISNVPDYTDLQNPIIGNPALKPAEQHTLTANYQRTKGKNRSFLTFSGSIYRNNITPNIILIADALNTLKQETHFVNTNGNYALNTSYNWGTRIGESKSDINFQAGLNYEKNIIYYNNIKGNANNLIFTAKTSANIRIKELRFMPDATYRLNRNTYLLGNKQFTTFHTINFNSYNLAKLTKNFALEAVVNKQVNMGYASSLNANPLMLDFSIYKWWLNRKIITSLECRNVMDAKARVVQSITGNTTSASSMSTLGRYFVINLIYDFKKIKQTENNNP